MIPKVLAALRHAVDVEQKELAGLLWSFAYFFAILCGYFLLRPVREEMAIAGGVNNLPWLFTGTFLVMLCVVPLFGLLTTKFPRRKFIPYLYWFFIANLLVFWILFESGYGGLVAPRAFFIWTSVFNLFIVSVFWSFMVDLFREDQSRRLFGFIAAGGTAGTIVGPLISLGISSIFGPHPLLLISAGFLIFAVFCVHKLLKAMDKAGGQEKADKVFNEEKPLGDQPLGGNMFSGITEIAKSPYMLGIALFVAMFTWTSTFVYFQQANIIANAFDSPAERTQIFAAIDLAVSTLTILTQLFITGRFIKKFGVCSAISFLPAVSLIGFVLFAFAPVLATVIGFQIIRRASNFAITRPGREMLFSVLNREQKYKSKNFIDTAVYRGGDALSGWAFAGLQRGAGLELGVIAAICVPISFMWMALAWVLGRRQMKMAKRV